MADKAVMWGHLINIASKISRAKIMELCSLTKTLDKLYNRYNQSPSPDLLQQITDKKQALDLLLSDRTEKALRWSKAKFMLYSNSASTMFAQKLNQAMKPSHFYKLPNQTGVLGPFHTIRPFRSARQF